LKKKIHCQNVRPEPRRLGQGIEVVIADVGHRGHTFALGTVAFGGCERWHPLCRFMGFRVDGCDFC